MGQQCPPTSSQGVRKPIEARFNRKQWDSQSPTHTHEHALDRWGAVNRRRNRGIDGGGDEWGLHGIHLRFPWERRAEGCSSVQAENLVTEAPLRAVRPACPSPHRAGSTIRTGGKDGYTTTTTN